MIAEFDPTVCRKLAILARHVVAHSPSDRAEMLPADLLAIAEQLDAAVSLLVYPAPGRAS